MASIGSVIKKPPLVQKAVPSKKGRKKGTYTYQSPSVISGLPHTIEGQPKLSQTRSFGQTQELRSNIKRFETKQRERLRITPIADPEAGASERRRTAARKRMRGRLGTLLSQRETLS